MALGDEKPEPAVEERHQTEGREPGTVAVVGLGNPGEQYERTRHNVGFLVVDQLAGKLNVQLRERRFKANWGWGSLAGLHVLLVKPLTFMNRSGEAVRALADHFQIPTDHFLVVHDDLDLPAGRIKLVQRGGAGGHRGVISIIEHLEDSGFPRLKLGIGRPLHGEPIESYVLQEPYSVEKLLIEEMIGAAARAVSLVLTAGLADTMNVVNRRDPQQSG